MAYKIPYHRETFRPKRSIPDNDQNDAPVEFELSMASGVDHARLKAILFATITLGNGRPDGWTPQVQANVVEAFRDSPQLFVNTVGKIRNLTAPAVLCRRVGLVVDAKRSDDDDVPIETGAAFARVAPYMSEIALEVALEIQRMSFAGAIDPRFSERPSGSPSKPAATSGSASDAQPTSGGDGTAERLM